MSDCIFCRIVSGEIPARKVYEDDQLIAFDDIAPTAPVHLLVIPKRHLVSLLDLTEADDALVGKIHRIAATLARERGIDQSGFRVVVNTNRDGGQSVFHLHFHLIGGRSMQWPPG
ncbi:MAG: histidine triad nucleotide-binding protein [Desulfuromonadia bacterium]